MTAGGLAEALRGRAPLYALLDAARDPAVLRCLHASGELFESLYDGRRGRRLADVAPYLALVSAGSALVEAMTGAGEGSGRSWGFFLVAPAPLAVVRRHLRRFLTVETEAGEALSFRFYDPRVVRPYLASATEEERRAFLGPVTALLVEDRAPGSFLCFERVGPAPPAPAPPWSLPRIRDAQRVVFAQQLADDLVDRAAERLSRPLRLDPAEARSLAASAVARAEAHGLVARGEIERYVDLVGVLGPGFDERLPWARAILARADLGAEHRLRRLERWLRRRRLSAVAA